MIEERLVGSMSKMINTDCSNGTKTYGELNWWKIESCYSRRSSRDIYTRLLERREGAGTPSPVDHAHCHFPRCKTRQGLQKATASPEGCLLPCVSMHRPSRRDG